MVFVLFGPSSSGKSTVAELIARKTGATIWQGKDYLRLAKNEQNAWQIFIEKLSVASENDETSIIYVITELDLLAKLQNERFIKVKFTATLEVLQQRFSERIKRSLPPPMIDMLNHQLQRAQAEDADLEFDTTNTQSTKIAEEMIKFCGTKIGG